MNKRVHENMYKMFTCMVYDSVWSFMIFCGICCYYLLYLFDTINPSKICLEGYFVCDYCDYCVYILDMFIYEDFVIVGNL